MADDTNNLEHPDDEGPAPLELDELEIRLQSCAKTTQSDQVDIICEIAQYGSAALPLMPFVVAQYRLGNLKVATSTLLELWVKTSHPPLIAALLEANAFTTCNIDDLCKLLENGITDVEADVMDYLWQNWERFGGRVQAIETLGRCGGSESLKMLRVIRARMAGVVQEQSVRQSLDHESPTSVEADIQTHFELGANQEFLDATRNAIRQIESRCAE